MKKLAAENKPGSLFGNSLGFKVIYPKYYKYLANVLAHAIGLGVQGNDKSWFLGENVL